MANGTKDFAGWKPEGAETILASGSKYAPTSNIKLVAQWGTIVTLAVIQNNGVPGVTPTDGLTLTFTPNVPSLKVGEITLSAGATKGAFGGTGPYTLGISVTAPVVTLTVGLAKADYFIVGALPTVDVYNGSQIPVTFQSAVVDGSETVHTTSVTLTFDKVIPGLSETDITIGGVTATKGTIVSNNGGSYTIPLTGFTGGGTATIAFTGTIAGYAVTGTPTGNKEFYFVAKIINVEEHKDSTPHGDGVILTFDKEVTGLTSGMFKMVKGSASTDLLPSVAAGITVTSSAPFTGDLLLASALANSGEDDTYNLTRSSTALPTGVYIIVDSGCTGAAAGGDFPIGTALAY